MVMGCRGYGMTMWDMGFYTFYLHAVRKYHQRVGGYNYSYASLYNDVYAVREKKSSGRWDFGLPDEDEEFDGCVSWLEAYSGSRTMNDCGDK